MAMTLVRPAWWLILVGTVCLQRPYKKAVLGRAESSLFFSSSPTSSCRAAVHHSFGYATIGVRFLYSLRDGSSLDFITFSFRLLRCPFVGRSRCTGSRYRRGLAFYPTRRGGHISTLAAVSLSTLFLAWAIASAASFSILLALPIASLDGLVRGQGSLS